jgi:hypothetical protein
MVRGGKGKSSGKQHVDSSAHKRPGAAAAKAAADTRAAAKKQARLDKVWRKQLKMLEAALSEAAKAEAKRVRKLEKARWRRQQLQAAVAEANSLKSPAPISSVNPPQASGSVVKTAAAPAAKTSAAKTPAKAAPAKAVPAKAPAKAAPAKVAAPAGAIVVEAYCLREKKRVQMVDPRPVVTANGGSALSGTCPDCGAALYKLVSRAKR